MVFIAKVMEILIYEEFLRFWKKFGRVVFYLFFISIVFSCYFESSFFEEQQNLKKTIQTKQS